LEGGENVANPILALIISFFLPGIGTVYAGNIMKGIIIFVVALILGALATVFLLGIIAYILYVIVWLYGMYDAYTTAQATA
jgi:TM2 domain-containing membrane protein YozV